MTRRKRGKQVNRHLQMYLSERTAARARESAAAVLPVARRNALPQGSAAARTVIAAPPAAAIEESEKAEAGAAPEKNVTSDALPLVSASEAGAGGGRQAGREVEETAQCQAALAEAPAVPRTEAVVAERAKTSRHPEGGAETEARGHAPRTVLQRSALRHESGPHLLLVLPGRKSQSPRLARPRRQKPNSILRHARTRLHLSKRIRRRRHERPLPPSQTSQRRPSQTRPSQTQRARSRRRQKAPRALIRVAILSQS